MCVGFRSIAQPNRQELATLRVPAGGCRIRVGDEIRHWTEGESLIFDDTFYHEAWNGTDDYRVVLFLDIARHIARPFKWPLSWVNRAVSQLLRFSPLVKQAKENHQQWEKGGMGDGEWGMGDGK